MSMRESSASNWGVLLIAVLVVSWGAASGCSVFYRGVELDQCESSQDCQLLGSEFQGTVCEASLCVTPSTSSSGGAPSTGGADAAGGMPGGSSPVDECSSNGECIDAHFGSPYLCREGSCLALTTPEECPIVIGAGQNNENLRAAEPIVFGAYSVVDPGAPRLSVPTLNYELAIDEVNQGTRGGLPGGTGGSLRPFIAVICSATNDPDLDASMQHLTESLKVPAIISSLYTTDLVSAFSKYGDKSKTFFLSPLEADSTLTNLSDEGRLWHLLSSARDLVPAYQPLLDQSIAHLKRERGLGPDEKLKVALLEAKTPFLTDIADELAAELEFNGLSVSENQNNDDFVRIRIDSALEVSNPDVSAALVSLNDFRPHIVLAVTSREFVPLLINFESGWKSEWGEPPFYLVSPYVFGRSDLASVGLSNVHRRMLGVNFAGALDTSIYDLYLAKLESSYDVSFSLEGSENFYDAAYFLMYAVAGSGNPSVLTGTEVALGMRRLLDGKTEYQVGSSDVSDVVGTLVGTAGSSIRLVGAMGPPDFNTATGARAGLPSVYCIDGGEYQPDVMLYSPDSKSLSGSPDCVPGFVP